MRLLHIKVKPGELPRLQQFYDSAVFTALEQTPGCHYACLIQSNRQKDETISMTLWDSKEHADEYELSGAFQALLEQMRPYVPNSSEWAIQLSKDLTLEYAPVSEEPTVKTYAITASGGGLLTLSKRFTPMHMRIVSVRIHPAMESEFRRLYESEIIPVLQTVKGCRYVYLTQNIGDKTEGISITVWESKEDADRYEQTGLYDLLKSKVKHTFTEMYQWKLELEKSQSGALASTNDDVLTDGYRMVTGKSFER
ncbi:MAG: antibiotic biosynthesis monooxygenase [Bacteroidota bacterium]